MATKYVSRALSFSIVFLAVGCGKGECRNDDDCDDGLFCNGGETCENSRCIGDLPPCNDRKPETVDICYEETDECDNPCRDWDEDGYGDIECEDGDDCDDTNPDVHPGAVSECQDIDVNCDGHVENDHDGDGVQSPECGGDDCDDMDPEVHPGAPEPCDDPPKDNNCVDGTDDEADTDGDGHVEEDCVHTSGGDDCDDEDPDRYLGNEEVCDGVDNDCDLACDDAFECCRDEPVECTTTCGSTGTGVCSPECLLPLAEYCTPPEEICNDLDDDCDTVADNDLPCEPGEIVECTTECDTLGEGQCQEDCTIPEGPLCIPPHEDCNGIDDDCDDVVDEGYPCSPGETVNCETTCGSDGLGDCTDTCTSPSPEQCTPPPYETSCNDGKDNDCDGWEDCWDEDCIGDISCS
jgi:hypothetical protein